MLWYTSFDSVFRSCILCKLNNEIFMSMTVHHTQLEIHA